VTPAILLDAGPLGKITNPNATPENDECREWFGELLRAHVQIFLPEIADYEVRRELLRAGKAEGIRRLDELKAVVRYLPINTQAMLNAAQFWAEARRGGQPAADDKALDGDVILAAQAAVIRTRGYDPVIATTNPKHLERFVAAKFWKEIVVPS